MYHFVNRESSIQSFYCLQLWTCGFVIARGGRVETVVPNQTQHFQQSSEFVFVRIIPSTPPSPVRHYVVFCVSPVCSSVRGKGQTNTKSNLLLSEILKFGPNDALSTTFSLFICGCWLMLNGIKVPYNKTIRATEGLYLSDMSPELQ